MQYVGRAFDSVSKTWSSINPSTLSGAIDIIVVENSAGELSCSPFHVRFGKFQLLRPSQKKVDFMINGKMTNLPMKLGDGGEAFFVFEASKDVEVPSDLITSPVLSAVSSPSSSPPASPRKATSPSQEEPEFLDISQSTPNLIDTKHVEIHPNTSEPTISSSPSLATSPKEANLEKLHNISRKLTERINIPTKVDHNGLFLDMNGYKSNAKNIHDTTDILQKLVSEEYGSDVDLSQFVKKDDEGNIIILSNNEDDLSPSSFSSDSLDTNTIPSSAGILSDSEDASSLNNEEVNTTQSSTNYVKTLRLTSDQLKFLDLKYGENDLCFSVDKGKALITSKLYLWKQDVPIVISDIDGTITKSDALGHVLTMIGRDWTHPGVAKLFTDIELNGYNILYLTARTVGQADSTRSYLRNIEQDGDRLPNGPVILSPDRTMAALRREVILKKPEVFKMACLNDLKNLYSERERPFYAGFGNRITDAISYRSVLIPSSRIFTINPIGEVHMELLELAGYKSSYVNINELVDHFFPPVDSSLDLNDGTFTDVNYWREPLPDLSDLSDDDDINMSNANPMNEYQKPIQKNQPQQQTISSSIQRLNLDDLDKDYNEEDDEDYYDDEDHDEDNDLHDDYTDESEDGSYDEEEDLDAELLQEDEYDHTDEEEEDDEEDISLDQSGSGFLPTRKSSENALSVNNESIIGINSNEDFIRASDLMNKLSLNDKK